MPHRLFGYCLLAVILGSPLLLTGGNEVLFTILLGLTLLLSFLFLLKQPIDGALKVPLRLFLAFIGCQLLTLIPLPVSWIRWLSPGLHKVLLNFPEVAYHTLSWDAILTMKTLAIYVAAAGVFLVAYHLWEDPLEKVPFVVQLFFWTGTFWVAVSLWLHYTTPGRVPFLPWQPEPWFFGLFTNSNIFAGYSALLAPIGIGLALFYWRRDSAYPGASMLAWIACVLLGVGIGAAHSAGAGIALLVSGIVIGVPSGRWKIPIVAALLLTLGWGIAKWSGPEERTSMKDRMAFNEMALKSVSGMPLVGSGLGTMGLSAPVFQPPLRGGVVGKVHNDWLELSATAGMTSLLLIAELVLLWRHWAGISIWKHSLRGGMIAGLLTLAIHSLVDFPSQNLTILVAAAALGGFVLRPALEPEEDTMRGTGWVMTGALGGALIISALLGWGLLKTAGGTISSWQIVRSLPAARLNLDATNALLNVHRLYAPLWGERARALEELGKDAEALHAVQKAIVLQPRNPQFYLLAARLSYVGGDDTGVVRFMTEAVALAPGAGMEAAPLTSGQYEQVMIGALDRAYTYYGDGTASAYLWAYETLKREHPAPASRVARRAEERLPGSPFVKAIIAQEAIDQREWARALDAAAGSHAALPWSYSAVLAARAAQGLGRVDESEVWLNRALETIQSPKELAELMSWGSVVIAGLTPEQALDFMKRCFRRVPSAELADRIGTAELSAGRADAALEWHLQSLRQDPHFEAAYRHALAIYRLRGDAQQYRLILDQAKRHFPDRVWDSPFQENQKDPLTGGLFRK